MTVYDLYYTEANSAPLVKSIDRFHMTSWRPYWCTNQWSGGHVDVPKHPVGVEPFSNVKTFLLFREICKGTDHLRENDLSLKCQSFLCYTSSEPQQNVGRPRWSVVSCSRDFRIISEALLLLYKQAFANNAAVEHLVFCIECSRHHSVIKKWHQVHSSRPVNAMQSLFHWSFSECSC